MRSLTLSGNAKAVDGLRDDIKGKVGELKKECKRGEKDVNRTSGFVLRLCGRDVGVMGQTCSDQLARIFKAASIIWPECVGLGLMPSAANILFMDMDRRLKVDGSQLLLQSRRDGCDIPGSQGSQMICNSICKPGQAVKDDSSCAMSGQISSWEQAETNDRKNEQTVLTSTPEVDTSQHRITCSVPSHLPRVQTAPSTSRCFNPSCKSLIVYSGSE
jgi:hypothetical protein